MNESELKLQFGEPLQITPRLHIKQPTIKEIEKMDGQYEKYLSLLITQSRDIADVLWVKANIFYEDIKSEWLFFIKNCIVDGEAAPIYILKNDSYIQMNDAGLVINKEYTNALNYFFETDGIWFTSSITACGIQQLVLINAKEKHGIYYLDSNDKPLQINESVYNNMVDGLAKLNWIKKEYQFTKGGTKDATTYFLEMEYRERIKKKKDRITISTIFSSLVAKGHRYKDVKKYPVYFFYESYFRLLKISEYENTMQALYNGCIDTKNHPINYEKIDWSSIIK